MRTVSELLADLDHLKRHHARYQAQLSRNAREDVDAFIDRAEGKLSYVRFVRDLDPEDSGSEGAASSAYWFISRAWLRYQSKEVFA